MNTTKLKTLGVETSGEGNRIAYFYQDQVIAMEDKSILVIFPTDLEQVSDIYCTMMEGTGYEHYVKNGVNYVTDGCGNRDLMSSSFGVRLSSGGDNR